MATSEELERELDRIQREIDELREREHEIEMALGAVNGLFKWLRAPGSYLLKRDVARQIQLLKWRNNAVRNCYLAVKRDEERKRRKSPFVGFGSADERSSGTLLPRI
jgi:sugar-specific transcriptional regulator TrmB